MSLDLIAPVIRADAAKYGIPLQRRTVAELKAWQPGITSHNDLRLAFGGTTHTDPGPNFPWDYFIDLLNQEDDMESPETRTHAFNTDQQGYSWANLLPTYKAVGISDALPGQGEYPNRAVEALTAVLSDVAELKARPPVQPAPVDAAALAAALAADDTFLDAIAMRVAATLTPEIRDAVADLGEGGAIQVREDAAGV